MSFHQIVACLATTADGPPIHVRTEICCTHQHSSFLQITQPHVSLSMIDHAPFYGPASKLTHKLSLVALYCVLTSLSKFIAPQACSSVSQFPCILYLKVLSSEDCCCSSKLKLDFLYSPSGSQGRHCIMIRSTMLLVSCSSRIVPLAMLTLLDNVIDVC